MAEAKIQRIFKHYGEQSQLIKTQEELKELDEAIQKLIDLNNADSRTSFYKSERDFLKDHVAEELADVRILLDQITFGLGIEKRCAEWREFKLNRQIKKTGERAMNWQLLSNVNPPLNRLLVFYSPDENAVFFGIRIEQGLKLANQYSNGLRDSWRTDDFDEYKKEYGHLIYWSLFVRP